MGLMDRFREARDDLRSNSTTPILTNEVTATANTAKEQETRSQPSVSQDVSPLAQPSSPTDSTARLWQSTEEKQRETPATTAVRPELQKAADELYGGRVDRMTRGVEVLVAEQVASSTGLPVDDVRRAASNIVLDAYVEQRQGTEQRLNPSVGAEHAPEFSFREKHGQVWTFDHRPTGQQIHVDPGGKFYDLPEGQTPREVSRQEVLSRFREIPERALEETPDHRRTWEPVEKALGYHGADNLEAYATRKEVTVFRAIVDERDHFFGADSKGRFYAVDDYHLKPTERISREQALSSISEQPHFYTPAEPTPTHKDWSRLEEVVGTKSARHFSFKEEADGIQTFQHDRTGGQVNLDSAGNLYNAERQRIGRDEALANLSPARAPEVSPALAAAPEPLKAERLSIEPSLGM